MKQISVNFVDFWPNFCKTDNYFYNLLDSKYNVVIEEEDPDLLFFSVDYSKKRERDRYKNRRCKKIFFTGENIRPNFEGPDDQLRNRMDIPGTEYNIGKSDIAFTFDYSHDPRNYRFPLWAFFINWFDKPYDHTRDPAYLVPKQHLISRHKIKRIDKTEFCNFLFSHAAGERVNILRSIQSYKNVSCPGMLENNTSMIGGRGDQIEKINFISQFKFTIAAENSKHDGYTTEKMIHPMDVASIPIYWGSDKVTEEFNEKAFINANKLKGEELIKKIIEIDQNNELYTEMISEPVFPNNRPPSYVLPQNVLKFIEETVL